jgi:hypothetical protein
MALSNKSDIKRELQHSMMPDEHQSAIKTILRSADKADKRDLEDMQKLLTMIAEADYEEPGLL